MSTEDETGYFTHSEQTDRLHGQKRFSERMILKGVPHGGPREQLTFFSEKTDGRGLDASRTRSINMG